MPNLNVTQCKGGRFSSSQRRSNNDDLVVFVLCETGCIEKKFLENVSVIGRCGVGGGANYVELQRILAMSNYRLRHVLHLSG